MEDGSSIPLWGSLVFAVILLLNGIFYGFAAALQNLSLSDTEKKAAEGSKKARRLEKLMGKPNLYINCMPVLAVLTGLSFGTFFVPFIMKRLTRYIPFRWTAVLVILLVTAVFMAAFGILAFRRVGTYHPESVAYRFVGIVDKMITVLYPITFLVTWIARLTAVLFGVSVNQEGAEVTEEEIISMVGEAHEQGVIEENEAEMIQNIISFNETEAQDIMTHRSNILAFDQEETLEKVAQEMLEEGVSRSPVYMEELDNIVGVVHLKDLMKLLTRDSGIGEKPLRELPELVREVYFIPQTRGIHDLFQAMQAKKEHMAVVVDEYGQTAGLVTMEDILEEIVGDILDEYDEEEFGIQAQVDDSILIEGMAYLEDVGEELKVDFSHLDFETLSGYLTSLLGHIPTEKDIGVELEARGYRFRILSIDHKTIQRVRAEKIIEKETEGEEETCQDIQNSQT